MITFLKKKNMIINFIKKYNMSIIQLLNMYKIITMNNVDNKLHLIKILKN